MAHEAAFALGQMQDAEAIPALKAVLNDFSLHPIVRHEVGSCLSCCSSVMYFICLSYDNYLAKMVDMLLFLRQQKHLVQLV